MLEIFHNKKVKKSPGVVVHTIIPVLRRLGYIVRPYLKKKKNTKNKQNRTN
jgi:hypothetical protein